MKIVEYDHKTKTSPPCIVCNGESNFLYLKQEYSVYRCSVCGLGFIQPCPKQEQLIGIYDQQYYMNAYRYNYPKLKDGLLKTYRHFLQIVMRHANGKSVGSVLDIGCSYGYFLDAAKDVLRADNLWGIDACQAAVSEIQKKGYHGVCGFIENTPLPEETFDLIFLGNCLEHLYDPISALDAIGRALKKDGTVLATTLNFSSLAARLWGQNWRHMVPPEHIFFWTPQAFRRLFENHCFKGGIRKYCVYAPKEYVQIRFRDQFGFSLFPLSLYPSGLIPVPAFDNMMGLFKKSGS